MTCVPLDRVVFGFAGVAFVVTSAVQIRVVARDFLNNGADHCLCSNRANSCGLSLYRFFICTAGRQDAEAPLLLQDEDYQRTSWCWYGLPI
jgi:hypothetical protein